MFVEARDDVDIDLWMSAYETNVEIGVVDWKIDCLSHIHIIWITMGEEEEKWLI